MPSPTAKGRRAVSIAAHGASDLRTMSSSCSREIVVGTLARFTTKSMELPSFHWVGWSLKPYACAVGHHRTTEETQNHREIPLKLMGLLSRGRTEEFTAD